MQVHDNSDFDGTPKDAICKSAEYGLPDSNPGSERLIRHLIALFGSLVSGKTDAAKGRPEVVLCRE